MDGDRDTDCVGLVHVPVGVVQSRGGVPPGVAELCEGGDHLHPPAPLLPLPLLQLLPLLLHTATQHVIKAAAADGLAGGPAPRRHRGTD